eukprot:3315803-Rhodomonas_salina.1
MMMMMMTMMMMMMMMMTMLMMMLMMIMIMIMIMIMMMILFAPNLWAVVFVVISATARWLDPCARTHDSSVWWYQARRT